jgi:hypothetical protein
MNLASAPPAPGIDALQVEKGGLVKGIEWMHTTVSMEP